MKHLALLLLISVLSFSSFAQERIVQELHFESSKSEVTSEAKKSLDDLFNGNLLEQTASIQLIGHTDSIGTLSYNIALSKKRVDNIYQYLQQQLNVPIRMISRSYHGETIPKYSNTNWENNRRVEVIVNLLPKTPIAPEPKPEPTPEDEDMTYEDGCLSLKIKAGTFAPYKNSEVTFKAIVLDESNRAQYNVTLLDNEGGRLISGGMIRMEATVNGKPVGIKKDIQAFIPAQPQLPVIENLMMAYMGEENEFGQIVWTLGNNPCQKPIYIPTTLQSVSKKGCRVYPVLIPARTLYFNCDVLHCAGVDCYRSMPRDDIKIPKDNFISSNEENSLLVSFLSGKPEKVELLHQPRPKRKLKAATNSLTNPPMFQGQNFHKDFVLKCKPEEYSASKEIRLFISKIKANLTVISKAPVLYVGEMDEAGIIQWNAKAHDSEKRNIIHCDYFTYKLPFTGYYKIIQPKSENLSDATLPIKVKTRKKVEVFAAHKDHNYIYYQLNPAPNAAHKNQFRFTPTDQLKKIKVEAIIYRKKREKKANLTLSKIGYNKKKKAYVIRRKSFRK